MDNLAVCAKTLHVVTVTYGQTKLKQDKISSLLLVVTICTYLRTVVKLRQAYRRPKKKITLAL